MKKILSLVAVAMVTATIFAGCDGTSTTTSSDTSSTVSASSATTSANNENSTDGEITPSSYNKDFDGFVQFMTDCGYIKGDGTDLTASAIGAKQGKRYIMSSGTAKIYVELYEFEANAAEKSDMAKQTIENAKTNGTFKLYDSTASATQNTLAAVSEDGRFLMLYTDASTNQNNIDVKNSAAEDVKSFSK